MDGGLRMGTSAGRWVLAGAVAGSSLASLDATVVNVALARIGADFGADFTDLQWITNGYTLPLAAFILLGGVLGDMFGRRRIFIIGTVWFALASALCGASVSTGMLIAARALQGVGAALLIPESLAILSATFVGTDRGRAIGAWSGLGGVATAVGPFLGGWLVEINWRLVFWINLPVAAVVVAIAWRHVPETGGGSGPKARIDLLGVATVVVALSALTYAATTAGQRGWDTPVIVVALVGLLASIVFVWIERRTDHPLVRLELFRNRVFAATNLVTVFIYAALSLFFFLLVLQLQVVSGWTPLRAGTSLLPVTVLMLLLSARSGALAERIGPRPLMTAGSLLAAAGFAFAMRIGPAADYLLDVLPAVVLLGLGLAGVVAPLTSAVLGAAPREQAGAASGINNAVARSAGLLAIAIVPAAAGLSGAGVSDMAAVDSGFDFSMRVGIGLLLVAAATSWFGVGRVVPEEKGLQDPSAPQRLPVHLHSCCPLSAPALHPSPPSAS
ncbi:MAG: hypothetical protein QOF52_3138 [Propionibacteriaceae bacterium]|nr:hypothetical protein [Propionibacteriaceae bacterium]